MTEIFEDDFTDFNRFMSEFVPHFYEFQISWSTLVDIAKGTEIPKRFLLGPWTGNMIKHLYWLVKSGAQVDWLTSTSGEVCSERSNTTTEYY